MLQSEAKQIMRTILNKHGLYNWKVGFNNRKKGVGLTKPKIKEVQLSRYLLKYSPDERIINTIKHEVAHALEYERYGYSSHGRRWQSIAIEVGAEPERTSYEKEYSDNIPAKYHLICPECGQRTPIHRRLKIDDNRYFTCAICRQRGIKSKLILKQNY